MYLYSFIQINGCPLYRDPPLFKSSLYTTLLLRKTYISKIVPQYWQRIDSRTPKDIEICGCSSTLNKMVYYLFITYTHLLLNIFIYLFFSIYFYLFIWLRPECMGSVVCGMRAL